MARTRLRRVIRAVQAVVAVLWCLFTHRRRYWERTGKFEEKDRYILYERNCRKCGEPVMEELVSKPYWMWGPKQ